MHKFLVLVVFLLVTIEIGAMGSRKPQPKKQYSVLNPELERDIRGVVIGGRPGIHVVEIINHTDKEEIHLKRAIRKVESVISSTCFEEKLLERKLEKTNNRTNTEVIEHIRSTSLEIEVEMYSKWLSRVAGYTYPSTNRIWTNRKFHNGTTDCNKGSNLLHEATHKMGYGHSFDPHPLRPFSVPYSMNWVMRECCE